MRSTVTSTDGTPIAYDLAGTGPAIVLVASALSDRSDAKRLAKHLAHRFTVINYDRRGRGESGDAEPYAVDREIDDIAALIDKLGKPVLLFGSSSGAVLALDAADRLTDRVRRVALFEPPFITDASRTPLGENYRDQLEQHLRSGSNRDAVRYFMNHALGMSSGAVRMMSLMPGWRKMVRLAPTLRYDAAIMEGTQSGGRLPSDRWQRVAAPALVMTGGKSEPFFHTGACELAELLPSARHEILDRASHAAVVATPKKLVAAMDEFLSSP